MTTGTGTIRASPDIDRPVVSGAGANGRTATSVCPAGQEVTACSPTGHTMPAVTPSAVASTAVTATSVLRRVRSRAARATAWTGLGHALDAM